MKYGLLLIALFIAATALTSGEYSSAPRVNSARIPNPNPSPSPSPNTTTHSPNTTTTHSPNTTTTHSPKTTTTHSPKTTTPMPVPTPPTNMKTGNYNVSDDKGNLCIMAVMSIGIRVNTSQVNDTFIVQPSKTNASGECFEKVATLNLAFNEGGIFIKFQKNDTTKKVYVMFVEYDLTYAFKAGESNDYSGKNRSLELFAVDLGHSYSCKSETVYMGNGVSLDLTHNQFQAFDIKNNKFGQPELCKADQPDYRVPIAVGIILIILIVIVVIAYLIRRKRRTDGYQSL